MQFRNSLLVTYFLVHVCHDEVRNEKQCKRPLIFRSARTAQRN